MPIRSSDDIDFMLRDAGVPVSFGKKSIYGILNRNDSAEQVQGGARMVVRITSLTIRTGTLPGITESSAITVGGGAYVVRDPELENRGDLTKILLAEATP